MDSATKRFGQSDTEKPLVIDLFCGLGGWSEAFLDAGFRAVGFDIERHDYGSGGYPGELVLRDVRSITGVELVKQYGIPACIVASPPCQEFSYMAMPWTLAKEKRKRIASCEKERARLTDLFNQCFRIQREVSDAAGRYVPLIVENVRGAQEWVGRARWNFGSFYLWGDVPALMPIPGKRSLKRNPDGTDHGVGSWFAIADSKNRGASEGSNFRFDGSGKSFQTASVNGVKTHGHVNKRDGHSHTRHLSNPSESEGFKAKGSGAEWFDNHLARLSSKSRKRKEASAIIAKIPFGLAEWIAKCFKPA